MEFNLSEKVLEDGQYDGYDVKEFIKIYRKVITLDTAHVMNEETVLWLVSELHKLAGDKLK